jgi:hypothetical protein
MTARNWPLPPSTAFANPDGSACTTIHLVSDSHFGYRPWVLSGGIGDHMLRDIQQGLIPPVHALVHTGDIIDDVSEFGGVSPLSAQDNYAIGWLNQANLGAPSLWAPGNHDLWDRPNRLRSEWEAVYGRPGNSYIDVNGYRIVGFCPNYHSSPDDVWQVDDATWSYLDSACGGTSNPVVLADHYPPYELGTSESIQPSASLDSLVSGHPNIVGMVTGHMHYDIATQNAITFTTIGGRSLPIISAPSAVFSQYIASRDQSARVPTISLYVSFYPSRWEVRYRMHGRHGWGGPNGLRVTSMDLTSGTITHGM